jgi:hypothetical protein
MPRHQSTPPLMEFAHLTEFFVPQCFHAHWVCVGPLRRSLRPTLAGLIAASTLRLLHRGLFPYGFSYGKSSLRFPLSFRVSPRHHHSAAFICLGHAEFLPRFFPFQRIQAAKSHLLSDASHSVGYVALSGFLTLSALCSLCCRAGLFHPATLLGFLLRGFDPSAVGTSFQTPKPSGLIRKEFLNAPPFKVYHCKKARSFQRHGLGSV